MRNISTWWQLDKKWELKWESEILFRLNSIKTEKTAGVECFECCSEKIFLNKIDVISEVGLWVETEKKIFKGLKELKCSKQENFSFQKLCLNIITFGVFYSHNHLIYIVFIADWSWWWNRDYY